jgi:DNA helicase II / ATP-dependent DNA helicase PcrA
MIPTHEPDAAGEANSATRLTPEQRLAASTDGPVLVLAGAGTGKTGTLTAAVARRIRDAGIEPDRILAVTFTNKAAAEMSARIRVSLDGLRAPDWIGTFHGLGARQLRVEPDVAGLRPDFEILDADDSRRLVRRTLKAMSLGSDDEGPTGRDPVKLTCQRIGKFKDSLIAPEEAAAGVEGMIAAADRSGLAIDAPGLREAARIYIEYQRRLREANAADFGDLLLWPTRAMQHSETYRRRWAERFDCIFADEYQDVCVAQYSWLRLLAADHDQLFVVGDDDQAIYSWRGSDLSFIRRFTLDFPSATQVRLEENFRSTGHILDAANAVIAKDTARLGKTLFTRKHPGDPIEVVRFHDADAEAQGIVMEIQQRASEGRAWDDMAVLYRSNFLSRTFEEAFLRARIPFVLVGDVGFYQRSEIKDALAFLRIALTPETPQSDEAVRRVINVPTRGFGAKAMEILEAEAAWRHVSLMTALETAALPARSRRAGLQFADAIRSVARDQSVTLADQISALLDVTGYRAMLRESRAETTEGRLENVQELIALAGRFHTGRELLDHAALATENPDENAGGQVRLMTLHKAKGLEFRQVFLPGWEANAFPPPYGDLAEERRLAYVALTRGMRRVTISYCNFRLGFADPSPFLNDIREPHRVDGWLRNQPHHQPQRKRHRTLVDALRDLELLKRF